MACMEHTCRTCGATVFNNGGPPAKCNECGSTKFSSYFDEEKDSDRRAYDYDTDEDD